MSSGYPTNRVRRGCAECGADGGLQIGRPHALFTERVIEPTYLVQQTRDIGHRAGERYLGLAGYRALRVSS